jgi:uncharacterized membrane protein YoaK (UPF0700 family)
MYLDDPTYTDDEKVFLGIQFGKYRRPTIFIGYLVAIMISLHRISYGYHYVSDVLVGALFGWMIGFTSYTICNTARNIYLVKDLKKKQWLIIRVILSMLALFAIIHFFLYKFQHLSAIKH